MKSAEDWPSDADGMVFKSLYSGGFNFQKIVEIDFDIDFDHWPLLKSEIDFIVEKFPNCQFYDPDQEDIDDGDMNGYVEFKITSHLTYDLVIRVQNETSLLVSAMGGICNSWGVLHG